MYDDDDLQPASHNDDTILSPDVSLQATCSVGVHNATHTPPHPHRAPDHDDDDDDDNDDGMLEIKTSLEMFLFIFFDCLHCVCGGM